MTTQLQDLDDLTLRVRSSLVRPYFAEAVRAFRAGALRSAVLSTWVAVTFDIIEKLRELAMHGDAAARAHVSDLDQWIARREISQLQAFETGILTVAKDQFELLSPLELEDLKRLKDNRNACAHPAYAGQETLFEPTVESVRAHLVHAALHLLVQPPVQGKSALARLQADMQGNAFPASREDVAHYVGPKYLQRAKEALVRNIVKVHVKELLSVSPSVPSTRIQHLLAAVASHRRSTFTDMLRDFVPIIVPGLDEGLLPRLVSLLAVDEETWLFVPEAERIRLRAALRQARSEPDEGFLVPSLLIPDLREAALEALNAIPAAAYTSVVLKTPTPLLVGATIKRLETAALFRDAEGFASALIALAPHLTPDDIARIARAARANNQVYDAIRVPQLLTTLFNLTHDVHPGVRQPWIDLVDERPEYAALRARLAVLGWVPPEEDDEAPTGTP